MAGFRSPLFLLGLGNSGQQVGFRGPLPLPQVGVPSAQQVGFRNALPLPQLGARGQQQAGFATPLPFYFGYAGEFIPPDPPDPVVGRTRKGANNRQFIEDDEILAVIMAAAQRWHSGSLH